MVRLIMNNKLTFFFEKVRIVHPYHLVPWADNKR